jgi:hypothetical protein
MPPSPQTLPLHPLSLNQNFATEHDVMLEVSTTVEMKHTSSLGVIAGTIGMDHITTELKLHIRP